MARQEKPDLVLLDIMLPEGIDGFEVARTLKQDPRTREIPIVALTAKVQQTDREEAFRAGVDDYLAKPFGLQELRAEDKAFPRIIPPRRTFTRFSPIAENEKATRNSGWLSHFSLQFRIPVHYR